MSEFHLSHGRAVGYLRMLSPQQPESVDRCRRIFSLVDYLQMRNNRFDVMVSVQLLLLTKNLGQGTCVKNALTPAFEILSCGLLEAFVYPRWQLTEPQLQQAAQHHRFAGQ